MIKLPFGRPMIGCEEILAVKRVLEGPVLVHGPVADCFEEAFANFTGAPYAISVSSCTAGMHLVYFALGIKSGDEVIVPAQTHTATAHAVELTGAKAVFVDSELESGNIDIEKLEGAITERTKAIAVVHYLGVPVDMIKVKKLASKYNLFILEDCALAVGTLVNGSHAGLMGDVGVFSFYPVKHFTTGEGGMIITRNETLALKLRHLRAFGVDRNHSERKVPGMYDVSALGFNYRMSEIHAAIGLEQIKKVPKFLETRRKNFEALADVINNLGNCRILPQPSDTLRIGSCYCLGLILEEPLVNFRVQIMEALGAVGIGTSIYYPQPVPRMRFYSEKYGYREEYYRNSALISDRMIAFPVGPHLTVDDMSYIGIHLKSIIGALNAKC